MGRHARCSEPFRRPLAAQDPAPLPYLQAAADFTFDIQLQASLCTSQMKDGHLITRTISKISTGHRPATRTSYRRRMQSCTGRSPGQRNNQRPNRRGPWLACSELTWRGASVKLPNGETGNGSKMAIPSPSAAGRRAADIGSDCGEVAGRVVPNVETFRMVAILQREGGVYHVRCGFLIRAGRAHRPAY